MEIWPSSGPLRTPRTTFLAGSHYKLSILFAPVPKSQSQYGHSPYL